MAATPQSFLHHDQHHRTTASERDNMVIKSTRRKDRINGIVHQVSYHHTNARRDLDYLSNDQGLNHGAWMMNTTAKCQALQPVFAYKRAIRALLLLCLKSGLPNRTYLGEVNFNIL